MNFGGLLSFEWNYARRSQRSAVSHDVLGVPRELSIPAVVEEVFNATMQTGYDSLAERSKAVAQGAIPKGRGFEPHSCHLHAPLASSHPEPGDDTANGTLAPL